MPGLDLSSLNVQELRSVLEAARSRNQSDLTQEVLSELHAREGGRPAHAPWRGRDQVQQPEAWWEDLRQEAELPEEQQPRSNRLPVILGIAAGMAVSAGLGWWLSPRGVHREEPAVAVQDEAPRAMVAYAPPKPHEPVAPSLRPPPEVRAPVKAPAVVQPPAARPVRQAAAPVRIAKAEPSPRTAIRPKSAAAMSPVCRAKPTPADRAVCASPALTAQHQRMRDAYDRAIDAGADPQLVDHDQAEWRAARNDVSDPNRLAKLYNRRIQQLNAAAKAAKASGPPI